jgi:hypothetical protein
MARNGCYMSIPENGRDSRGRFVAGNTIASAGGQARAKALTKRRRRAIARKARRAMVRRHFGGDDTAQRRYLAALGRYAYEVAAGSFLPGSPLRTMAQHPGSIQEWRQRYYQLDLYCALNKDVIFTGSASQASTANASASEHTFYFGDNTHGN